MCFEIKNEEIKGIIDAIGDEKVKEMDIHEKMFYITTLMEVKKDTDNNHSNFKYSSLTAIKLALNPLALKFRVRFKFDKFKSSSDEKGKKTMNGTIIAINVDKKDDTDSLDLDLPHKILTSGGMTETESTGATITYLERYLYRTMLNIADGDDDPDNFVGKNTKGKTPNTNNKVDHKKDFQKEVEKECKDVQDHIFKGFIDKYDRPTTVKTCIYLNWKEFNTAKERLKELKEQSKNVTTSEKNEIKTTTKIGEDGDGGEEKKITAQQKIKIQNLINFIKADTNKIIAVYKVRSLEGLKEKQATEIIKILEEKKVKMETGNSENQNKV